MEDITIKLLINGVGTASVVHPVFGDNVNIKFDREQGQVFRREKIDGTFKFYGADFNLIYGCSIYTTFSLQIFREGVLIGTADFLRTDCEFNLDDGVCEVKLTTKDKYEKFLAAYNNTYNLVKLAPERESVVFTKRAVLQFYVKGENVVTNVVGGVSYEQPCSEVQEESDLRNKYFFGGYIPISYIEIYRILDNTSLVDVAILGVYEIEYSTGGGAAFLYVNKKNPRYRIQLTEVTGVMMILMDSESGKILASCDTGNIQIGTQDLIFYKSGGTGTSFASFRFHCDGELFCRLLVPYGASGAFERSMDADITEYDQNYPYVIKMALDRFANKIKVISHKSTSPTEWGTDSSGKYFESPSFSLAERMAGRVSIPIGQSHWERMSAWILPDEDNYNFIDDYDLEASLKDAYPLWSAIRVMLNEIDPSLSFGNTPEYSQFLFGTDGNSQHLISYNSPAYRGNIYISPITNVKKTFYEQAAQKGDISLKQILDMLRNFYQCYWWIDDDNRLRIEHIIYFKNGNTYERESPVASIDITDNHSLPTKESWGFAQNTIAFDTSKHPSRYEFSWGDKCTYPFTGEPIDVKDKYLKSSKKESVSVSNFISDIDYIFTNGGSVSNDIFAVFEADKSSGKVRIADVRLNDESPRYRLQNAYMSFLFAERNYYPYDLSGWRAMAGKTAFEVYRTKEIAKQSLSCPLTLEEMRSIGIIRTELGNGIIDKMSAEISTLFAKNTILYEQKENISDKIYFSDYISSRGYVMYFNPTFRKARVKVGIVQDGVIQEIRFVDVPFKGSATDVMTAGQTPMIMDVEDISAFTINRRFSKAEGRMTFDESRSSGGVYVLIIRGNEYDKNDFAGIHITANRTVKVKIEVSSEDGYDKAYISNAHPCCTTTSGAEVTISGITQVERNIPGGTSRYIGYIKDGADVENDDIVTITIEEV